jgi:hypothetical protein
LLDNREDVLAYHSHVKRVGSALERFNYVSKRGPTALERLEAKKAAAAAGSEAAATPPAAAAPDAATTPARTVAKLASSKD